MSLRALALAVLVLGTPLAHALPKDGAMDQLSDDARRIAEAAALERRGKYAEAAAQLDARPFGAELELEALLLKAQILERAELPSVELYESALKRFPDHAAVNLRFALAVYRRGDLKRAEELLRRAWRAAPLPEAAYWLGRVYGDAGRVDRAGDFFARCIALEPERGAWRQASEAALAALMAHRPLPADPRP